MSRFVTFASTLCVWHSACAATPDGQACHWAPVEAFYLPEGTPGCRDALYGGKADSFPCNGWAQSGAAARSASSDSTELRAWLDRGAVYAQPMHGGACIGAVVIPPTKGSARELAMAWTGEFYEIVWSDEAGTWLTRVDESSWVAYPPRHIADPSVHMTWLAAPGYRVLARAQGGAGGSLRLYDGQLHELGAADPGPSGAELHAVLGGAGGNRLGVVWDASGSNGGGAMIYALERKLAPELGAPILAGAMNAPQIAWTGRAFFTAWWESGEVRRIYGATFAESGVVRIARTELLEGVGPAVAAGAGGLLVVYAVHDSSTYCFGELRAARISETSLAVGNSVVVGPAGRSLRGEYAASAVGGGFQAAAVATAYLPSELGVAAACRSPLFIGLDGDGVAYTQVPERSLLDHQTW